MRQPCGLILFLQPPDFFHAFLGLRHLSDIIRILAIALFQKGNVCPGSLGKLLSFGEDIAADIIGTPFFCGQDAVRQRNGYDMIIFLLVQNRQDPDAEIVGAQEQRMEGGTALHIDDLPDLVPVITTAMFLGMYGTMAAPHLTNFSSLPAVAAILVSGVTAIGVNKLAAGRKKLKEFAFPLSMLVGMFASCIVNAMIV